MRRRKQSSFKPNSAYIQNAVDNFIKSGGKIKRVDSLTDDDFQRMISQTDTAYTADQYLRS